MEIPADGFVAIKVVRDRHAGESARRRLLRESRSALNHPHICSIHEIGDADGEPFIVREFVERRSPRDLIGSDGLALSAAIPYAIQIADAIAHGHDRLILHRELKTSNVMIISDGRARALDLGLAQREQDQELEGVRAARPHSTSGPNDHAGLYGPKVAGVWVGRRA